MSLINSKTKVVKNELSLALSPERFFYSNTRKKSGKDFLVWNHWPWKFGEGNSVFKKNKCQYVNCFAIHPEMEQDEELRASIDLK